MPAAKKKQNQRNNASQAKNLVAKTKRTLSNQQSALVKQKLRQVGFDYGQGPRYDIDRIVQILTTVGMPEKVAEVGGVARYNPGVVGTPTSTAAPPSAESYAGTSSASSAATQPEALFVLQRNAPANQIHRVTPPTGAGWKYSAQALSDAGNPHDDPDYNPIIKFDGSDCQRHLKASAYYNNNSDWKKHGDMYLNARTKNSLDERLIPLDVGEAFEISGTVSVNSTIQMIVKMYDSGSLKEVTAPGAVAFVAGTPNKITYTNTTSDFAYFCFDLKATVATNLTVADWSFYALADSVAVCHRHLCVETYCKNIWTWPEVAILGSTLRYQNNAAILNKEGAVVCADLPPGKMWTDYATYKDVASISGRKIFDVSDGAQVKLGLKAPDNDLGLHQYAQLNANDEIVDSYWPLEQEVPSVLMACSIPSADARACTIEVVNSVEFRTTDLSRSVEVPNTTKMEWLAALQEFHCLERFTKNASHLEEFLSGVRKAVNRTVGTAVKYGPRIAGGIMSGVAAAQTIGSLL